MTKFILHGGAANKRSAGNDRLYAAIAEDLPEGANILLVYFAKPEAQWLEKFEKNKKIFEEVIQTKHFNFELAQKDSFNEQIKKADVIYIHGGKRELLDLEILKIENFKSLIEGKVLAVESAGSNVLAEYYYDNDKNNFFKGAGLLPIKTWCHYGANHKKESPENKNIMEKLKNFGKNLPVYALSEEQFVIINQ